MPGTLPKQTRQPAAIDDLELITIDQLGELLKKSRSAIDVLVGSGAMPRPVRIGRAVRFRRSEIAAWIDRGCPRIAVR